MDHSGAASGARALDRSRPGGTTLSTRTAAAGALAIGALAIGALAIGALAIGRLSIGGLALKRGRARSVVLEELDVGRLHVRELVIDSEAGGRRPAGAPPVRD
jgi:hypothetical protein